MAPGAAFWVTGLPGSGKTSLALAAQNEVQQLVVLHMDEMRRIVTPTPTYSASERETLYMSIVYTALVLTREGHDVIIDATANMRVWRDRARALIPDFHEVYVKCPLEVAVVREGERVDALAPKGIYKKAGAGWPVPGVNVPYEEPLKPELTIDTSALSSEEAGKMLADYIKSVLAR